MERHKERVEKLRALLSNKRDDIVGKGTNIAEVRAGHQSIRSIQSNSQEESSLYAMPSPPRSSPKPTKDTSLSLSRPAKRSRIGQIEFIFSDKENVTHDASQLPLEFDKIRSYVGAAQLVSGGHCKRLIYHCVRAVARRQISTFSSKHVGTACLECTEAREPCVRLAEGEDSVWTILPLVPHLRKGNPYDKQYWVYSDGSQVLWSIFNEGEPGLVP